MYNVLFIFAFSDHRRSANDIIAFSAVTLPCCVNAFSHRRRIIGKVIEFECAVSHSHELECWRLIVDTWRIGIDYAERVNLTLNQQYNEHIIRSLIMLPNSSSATHSGTEFIIFVLVAVCQSHSHLWWSEITLHEHRKCQSHSYLRRSEITIQDNVFAQCMRLWWLVRAKVVMKYKFSQYLWTRRNRTQKSTDDKQKRCTYDSVQCDE